ncbi:hypothetical protein NY406_04240 [Chlorobaculum sp. MV4-Y]|jgi:hypothetical protein|uniref:hypothetical protein n=1 Tax=Chlorobaculum sp. MV4-Y TaxID=2976335 RepID=UPI0021AFD7AD|nr:hypothetical protein [Chlorobaculum sp. MV4-Y]UWX58480.1 hypothetical protein NY406_04240 [Chlorobaculum sp. MV4-Y]
MLKEAAAVTGGALLLPPLGVSMVACGVPGLLIAGAGFFVFDAMMKEKRASAPQPSSDPANEGEENWQTILPEDQERYR